ncbi:putative oxidoreductase [compost metagenome]
MTKANPTGIHRYDAPAGGWGALKATAKAVADQMRIPEAPVLLLRTNKPDGFDCPGCAWPDKSPTSTSQFCENGAKAVTWEPRKSASRRNSSPRTPSPNCWPGATTTWRMPAA